jgi:hypothetical protein
VAPSSLQPAQGGSGGFHSYQRKAENDLQTQPTSIPHVPRNTKPLAEASAWSIEKTQDSKTSKTQSIAVAGRFPPAPNPPSSRLSVSPVLGPPSGNSPAASISPRPPQQKRPSLDGTLPRCVFHHHDNDGRPSCSSRSRASQFPQRAARLYPHHHHDCCRRRRKRQWAAAPAPRSRAPFCRALVVPPPEASQSHNVREDSQRPRQGADAGSGEHAHPDRRCPATRAAMRCGVPVS